MKTALITGAFGQDGYFLTKRLIETKKYHIICTSYAFKNNFDNVYNHKNVDLELLDIRNEYEIYNIIKKYKPDELYHLASFSAPIIFLASCSVPPLIKNFLSIIFGLL